MNGRHLLLDTNCIVALWATDPSAIELVANATKCHLPVVVIGELYYGAYRSGRVQENLNKVDELLGEFKVLGCNVETGQIYGRLKHQLRMMGKPIPENDLWIGAIAKQHNLLVATKDHHFQAIEAVETVGW